MKWFRQVGLLCMAISSMPGGAWAQVDVPPDGLRVVPTVRLLYDDNIYRRDDNFVVGDKDDIRITPSVDVTLRRQMGMHLVTVVGSLGYDFHDRNKFLDRERIALTGDADLSIAGYCHARPRVRLNFAQANLSDQGVIVGNSQRTQDYRLTVDCEKPYGIYPVATIGYLTTTNSADARRIFNINTLAASIGAGYSKASLGDIRLMFEYERFRRPNADDLVPDMRSGADNYSVGLTFRRHVAPRLSWQVSGSYIRTKPLSPMRPEFSGLGFGAQANWRPSPRFSLIADLNRSSRNQSNTGATYIVETDYGLRGNLAVGSRSTISAGATALHRRFKGELLLDVVEPRLRDTTRAVFGSYRYALRKRLNLGTEVRHERRTTPIARYRYHYTSAMIFIGLEL